MYVIDSGRLVYRRPKGMKLKNIRRVVTLGKKQWLCENPLWVPWKHRGAANTVTECNIIVLDADKFCSVSQASAIAFPLCKEYAINFLEEIQQPSKGGAYPAHMLDVQMDWMTTEDGHESSLHAWAAELVHLEVAASEEMEAALADVSTSESEGEVVIQIVADERAVIKGPKVPDA
eukprot:gnl/TRDRNA2_/TRDRNA2_213213_c0_seq1.p1 gnl/TRDRNA2_/TRDRNA2_213213_c0~~gnl/TRDRNA2_/TRDRNA2_213213_c0_seq1.p1  ORF type:complete len:176 (+),score=31.56 gnl/TRDRNA2_/TRDRNA2_213213_c0_seq1:1-528(+)